MPASFPLSYPFTFLGKCINRCRKAESTEVTHLLRLWVSATAEPSRISSQMEAIIWEDKSASCSRSGHRLWTNSSHLEPELRHWLTSWHLDSDCPITHPSCLLFQSSLLKPHVSASKIEPGPSDTSICYPIMATLLKPPLCPLSLLCLFNCHTETDANLSLLGALGARAFSLKTSATLQTKRNLG